MKQVKAVVTLGLFMTCCVSAATYYVDASRADDSGAGTGWNVAKRTIQAAVDLAGDGDIILVTNGVYREGGDPTNRVFMGVGHQCILTAVSTNPSDTVIDGMGTNRCVWAATKNAGIAGFMLTNGWTVGNGGGARGGTLSNCLITGCSASAGGGVSVGAVYDSSIAGNVSTSVIDGGGGVHSAGPVHNSLIVGNRAVCGGGMAQGTWVYNSVVSNNYATVSGGAGHVNVRLFDCLIVNNSSGSHGGGLSRGGVASNCVIRGNTAVYGGAVGFSSGYAHYFYNCLIVDNEANRCGAIFHRNDFQPTYLFNCTIVSNRATDSGYCAGCSYQGGAFPGPFIVTNSIIRYNMNTADGVESNYAFTADSSVGYSLTWPDVTGADYDNGNNMNGLPCFVGGDDYRLQYKSPCVDAGVHMTTLSNDLNNVTRPLDGKGNGVAAYDMGCYEYELPCGGSVFRFW